MQLTLVYSQFYTSFRLCRQFIYNLANIFKLKPHPLSLILIFRCYHSRRSTHRVVNTQPGDLSTLKLISLIYFSRQIDCYDNPVLTILTRSTTGPVKTFYFYFFSIPHRVVSEQPGIQHSKHFIFQFLQYTEYHCIRVQKIPASKSTSTKQLFLFQFYTIVNQNRNFNFGQFQIHLHVSTNRESDWKLVKFHCLPFTS